MWPTSQPSSTPWQSDASFSLPNDKLLPIGDVDSSMLHRLDGAAGEVEHLLTFRLHHSHLVNLGGFSGLPCPSHLLCCQRRTAFCHQEVHRRKMAVGIAADEEVRGVCGDEVAGYDADSRRGEGIVGQRTGSSIAIRQVLLRRTPGNIACEHMVVARHVDGLAGCLAVYHIIIVALVHGRRVLLPAVTGKVMVGVDAV